MDALGAGNAEIVTGLRNLATPLSWEVSRDAENKPNVKCVA